jgi:hypothetical protein
MFATAPPAQTPFGAAAKPLGLSINTNLSGLGAPAAAPAAAAPSAFSFGGSGAPAAAAPTWGGMGGAKAPAAVPAPVFNSFGTTITTRAVAGTLPGLAFSLHVLLEPPPRPALTSPCNLCSSLSMSRLVMTRCACLGAVMCPRVASLG